MKRIIAARLVIVSVLADTFLRGNAVTSAIGGTRYDQISACLNHALSKRPGLYVSAEWQKVSGDDSTAHATAANIADLSPSSNHHKAVARVGIRHNF